MGCASSKQPKPSKCKHCNAPASPVRRSYSVHVHHPPLMTGDSYHVVALQSSTLGSLRLDEYDALSSTLDRQITHHHDNDSCFKNGYHHQYCADSNDVVVDRKAEFELGMIEAKAWSQMIDEKITKVVVPRTPIQTPPGEPEMIDAWEMMNGLEDTSPLLRPAVTAGEHTRSFSFHVFPSDFVVESPRPVVVRTEEEKDEEEEESPESIWVGSNVDKNWSDSGGGGGKLISKNLVSDFDPEMVMAFRKALQELSPKHPLHFNRNGGGPIEDVLKLCEGKKMNVGVLDREFEEQENTKSNGYASENNNENSEHDENEDPSSEQIERQQVKERLVLYFTSLRGVRKTYENCCDVRMILKSIGVRVDERDVSMHSVFKEELQDLMNKSTTTTTTTPGVGLPQLFLGEKYVGGVEEIRKLHEDGELEKILSGCERMKDDEVSGGLSCEGCGDIRFVPCETCSGSCKIYCEEEDDEAEEEDGEEDVEVNKCIEESGEFGFQRCPDCNENGLIRCPYCCYN